MEITVLIEAMTTQGWEAAKLLANSQFGSSLLAAMTGAWGGAHAAQRIATKDKRGSRLYQELLDTNAAIELSAMVVSTHLCLKKQHLASLLSEYQAQRAKVHAHFLALNNGTVTAGTVCDIGGVNMEAVGPLHVNFDKLEEIVMGKLSVSGRPRPLMAMLAQSIRFLEHTISERNELVQSMKTEGIPISRQASQLFGLRTEAGIDDIFGQTVEALHKQTDDCIQFGIMLSDELMKHGAIVRKQYIDAVGGIAPNVVRLTWNVAGNAGMLPDAKNYADWLSSFTQRVPTTRGRPLGQLIYQCKRTVRTSRLIRQSRFARSKFAGC